MTIFCSSLEWACTVLSHLSVVFRSSFWPYCHVCTLDPVLIWGHLHLIREPCLSPAPPFYSARLCVETSAWMTELTLFWLSPDCPHGSCPYRPVVPSQSLVYFAVQFFCLHLGQFGGLWFSVPQQGRSEWAGFPGDPRVTANMNWARSHSFLPLFLCVKCLRHPSLHLQGQQLLMEGHHPYMRAPCYVRAPWEVASCVLREALPGPAGWDSQLPNRNLVLLF